MTRRGWIDKVLWVAGVSAWLAVASPELVLAAQAQTQDTSGSTSAAQASQSPPAATRVFASDAGMVLDFISRIGRPIRGNCRQAEEALASSDKPERRQQAARWTVFRALEPGANGAC